VQTHFRAFAEIGIAEEPYKHVVRYWTTQTQREIYSIQLQAIPTHNLEAYEQLTAPAFAKTGKRRAKRFLSAGECDVPARPHLRKKTLAGEPVGGAAALENRAAAIAAAPSSVTMLGGGQALVRRPGAQQPHVVDILHHTCEGCDGFHRHGSCSHILAAATASQQQQQQTTAAPTAEPAATPTAASAFVTTDSLRKLLPHDLFE